MMRRRSGSLAVVIAVASILGILAGVAFLMSSSYGRRNFHEKLVFDARGVARQAVEEASLMINNGEADLEIAQAVSKVDAVELDKVGSVASSPLKALKSTGKAPKVFVKATVVNDRTWRTSAKQQYENLAKVLATVPDADVQAFLKRMRGEHADYKGEGLVEKDTLAWKSSALAEQGQGSGFWNGWVNAVGVSKWTPTLRKIDKDFITQGTPPNEVKLYKYYIDPIPPAPMKKLYEVFYQPIDTSSVDTSQYYASAPPFPSAQKLGQFNSGAFKQAWEEAVKWVAQDAAKKVQACGGNPALAMAHLVGDLKVGKAIASDAEISATREFMVDQNSAAKTYLLEITASMGYAGTENRQAGQTAFRSYRILQRIEWEEIVNRTAKAMAGDMIAVGNGCTAQTFASMWPPKAGVKGEDEELAPGVRWNPVAFLGRPLYAEMPSSVGSRLYPYGVGKVRWNAANASKTDATGQ